MRSDKSTFDERPTAAELRHDEVAYAWNTAKNAIAQFADTCGCWVDAAEDIARDMMDDIEEAVRENLIEQG